jgi:Domain of unknown function (DUF4331)
MQLKRMLGTVTAIGALTVAVVLYTVHPVKSSDHQDTYNLATSNGHNTSADITDVYVFPAPDDKNDVVFAMDVSPLIAPGMGTTFGFDSTLLWQFKISHSSTTGIEDQVIQMTSNGGPTSSQVLSLYGPAAPGQIGTTNTVVGSATGTTAYNKSTTFPNGIKFFAGPRRDPFVFDLFAFFTFAGDRNYGTHASQSDPGAAGAAAPALGTNGNSAANIAPLTPAYDKAPNSGGPSFNGFAAGTMSVPTGDTAGPFGQYACSTSPATDILDFGKFNVLSYVVEIPKALISGGGSTIHVWATVSSSTTSS